MGDQIETRCLLVEATEQKNSDTSMIAALGYTVKTFGASMLHIHDKVDGYPVEAFIDRGNSL